MMLKKYWANRHSFVGEHDNLRTTTDVPVYLAADVEAVLLDCVALAAHVVQFPYGHNANGCVEYRDEVKARAQALLAQLKGDQP